MNSKRSSWYSSSTSKPLSKPARSFHVYSHATLTTALKLAGGTFRLLLSFNE
ncbi:MAG: hypothetical protein OWQ48_04670 [Desulfurococcus sp.]|nr:hypothetical protein [Desulfurococcus sp.]